MDILNRIELNDGSSISGIIDYVTTKHVYFFKIHPDIDLDYLMLAIMWMGNADHLRFSVYCAINYPGIELPTAILVPVSAIKNTDKPINITEKPKHKKRMLKI